MSSLLACIGFGAIAVLGLASRQRTLFGFCAAMACAVTAAWAGGLYVGLSGVPLDLLESLRLVAWASVPVLLVRRQASASPRQDRAGAPGPRSMPMPHGLQALLVPLAIGLPLLNLLTAPGSVFSDLLSSQLLPAAWLGLALGGLVQLERVHRRADPQRRRAISLLCLSLGALLVIDFLYFTDALLFRRSDPFFLNVRAWANAALSLPLAVALARVPERAMQLHVSRPAAAASSAVLLAAGLYLLLVAAAGYALRRLGISADGPLEVVVGVLIGCVLAVLIAWPALRRRLKVTLAKHLFSYKYDYRQEWLSFTDTLADNHLSTPQAILSGMCRIVNSPSGALWATHRGGALSLLAERHMPRSERIAPSSLRSLQHFLERTRWLVDLDEYRRYPERYAGLTLPAPLVDDSTAWLLVPLPRPDALLGVALIGRSPLFRRIDWEDRDLLKAAGHQGAGQLALFLATEQLAESREFDAFNRTSAYVVHDLKNILGQQTLIVANAERHRHKPAFVDDVIETIEHSVSRMNALLQQLEQRRGAEDIVGAATPDDADLRAVVQEVCAQRSSRPPVPRFETPGAPGAVPVGVEWRSLMRIVGHLVQNAQEASRDDGAVTVRLERDGTRARVVVRDEGAGMSHAFIRERLFRPFDSTKGLTGMGIGVFEARDVARQAGGELSVESRKGRGSTFTLELPLVEPDGHPAPEPGA